MRADIQSILKRLGIEPNNAAYSTGSEWGGHSGSNSIDSFSPVDGKKLHQ